MRYSDYSEEVLRKAQEALNRAHLALANANKVHANLNRGSIYKSFVNETSVETAADMVLIDTGVFNTVYNADIPALPVYLDKNVINANPIGDVVEEKEKEDA